MSDAPLAAIAFGIAQAAGERTLVYLCDDDQQAEALAAAVRALATEALVIFLPSSDALPGDASPPSPGNVGRRTAALRQLRRHAREPSGAALVCILSGEAAGQRYSCPADYDRAPPVVTVGDAAAPETFASMLAELGYFADDRVDEPGEVAVRGDVIDIFPADAVYPARLEIADGRIAAIRSYDPLTQRSIEELGTLEIGRAAEPVASEYTSILAHLAPGVIGMAAKADARRKRFITLAEDAAARAGQDRDATGDADWQTDLGAWMPLDLPAHNAEALPRFAEARSPLAACANFVKPLRAEGRALLLVGSARDLRFLRPRLEKRLQVDFATCASWPQIAGLSESATAALVMPVEHGFVCQARIVLAAGDLLGSRALVGEGALPTPGETLLGGAREDLRIGDVVVHEDHGVGCVAGLEAVAGADSEEMIALAYSGGHRRLVAPQDAHRLWRYGGDAEAVTLDRLDGRSWRKRRAGIDDAVAQSARSLAKLAADRRRMTAPAINPDPAEYERFVSGFAFNETADQARAINAVRDDLVSGRPMDRLVVGDVGYGKTEVALRAAALAALAGYQVIVAAPTTVLVRQHLETFRQRFSDSGVAVAGLSRLSSAAEKKSVKSGLADGSIGIVVGTGAVMAKSVRYARLGLVVVDEEQRFGSADKTRLRGDGGVHILTLSATPIPRTLQMALVGLQTMSMITTPPARRQPIRTSVDRFDEVRVRTALEREKARGGQSFVVVPRIADMAKLGDRLRRLVPSLTVVSAHGKLAPSEVDAVMVDFANGTGDVLLATNIIEAGLNIPRANTMIVWRADQFGLAQLHQLRGRVGRSHRRGQVYLLTDDEAGIADRTLKRLRTLSAFDQLGAGFAISAQDLDMRGGGELVGETQAGHIKLIGIDLYQHLLQSALRQARGEAVEDWLPELRIGAAGGLPASWIPEADLRLGLYARLARLATADAVDAFEEELIDRFGPVPEAADRLLAHARLRMLAQAAKVARVDAGRAGLALTPRPDFSGDLAGLGLIPKSGRWVLSEPMPVSARLARLQDLLERLSR